MILGFKYDEDPNFKRYLSALSEKLNQKSIVLNPFNGRIIHNEDDVLILLKPLHLNLPFIGFPIAAILYYFFGWHWFLIPILIVSCFSIFWSSFFYRFIIRLGLKKNGYTKKVQFI